jgi:hypothetical protein
MCQRGKGETNIRYTKVTSRRGVREVRFTYFWRSHAMLKIGNVSSIIIIKQAREVREPGDARKVK